MNNPLEVRMTRLENQMRLWRLGTILGLSAFAILLLVGLASNRSADVVTAREFVLVDDNGSQRARLGTYEGMTALQLFDSQDNMRIALHVYGDGLPQIYVNNTVSGPGIVIDGGTPAIGFFGEKGKPLATIP